MISQAHFLYILTALDEVSLFWFCSKRSGNGILLIFAISFFREIRAFHSGVQKGASRTQYIHLPIGNDIKELNVKIHFPIHAMEYYICSAKSKIRRQITLERAILVYIRTFRDLGHTQSSMCCNSKDTTQCELKRESAFLPTKQVTKSIEKNYSNKKTIN